MYKKHTELKMIYGVLTALFLLFLCIPIVLLLYKSIASGNTLSLSHYRDVLTSSNLIESLENSFAISGTSAFCTTILAFLLAYSVNYTNIKDSFKKMIINISTLPMLLPTITYGFAILYTFGKQGLLTQLLHVQLFDIYGYCGLLLGYVIYTLPIAFLLLNNTMKFIDKKFVIVSKIMGDARWKRFIVTLLIPMVPTICVAFIQSFFLCFTDFGIPAALGGEFNVIATTLYNEMLGSIPNFNNGAVVAMIMLLPSIGSVIVLHYVERFNVHYHKVSKIELPKNVIRDNCYLLISSFIACVIVSIFLVIIILPFMQSWPYEKGFSLQHISDVLSSSNLLGNYRNSLLISFGCASVGTIVAYSAALINVRSKLPKIWRNMLDVLSSITNAVPGMVIGVGFLFAFSGTSLQNTFLIMIACNIIHFYATPYLMAKSTLGKMNTSYESTALLMGDSWFKTIRRVVIPNSKSTILEMFSYYFINSMVTISALIFIVGAKTSVLTTKIKELQHFGKFDEIFVLSLLILLTNLFVKWMVHRETKQKTVSKKDWKKYAISLLCIGFVVFSFIFGNTKEQVIIYSNADEEALFAIKEALNENGFKNQYIISSFGTSELGGKIMAEGKHLEADLITMSTYYIDSAQQQNQMFKNLTFKTNTLKYYSDYDTPITALEGTLILNTKVLHDKQLPVPASLKDLTKDIYKGYISIPDMNASSTGWLLVQAIFDNYEDKEANLILSKIIENVGPHLETSGSGPLKKVRSGEVGIAFGLRHQAIKDKKQGLPINYVDPTEGNYQLTESIAVVKKEKNNSNAMAMARCMMEYGRKDLLEIYPTPLYQGEVVDAKIASKYPKVFPKALHIDLLKEHQAIYNKILK